jgi:hypothetical protein
MDQADIRTSVTSSEYGGPRVPPARADRVISRARNNQVAFRSKRTSSGT